MIINGGARSNGRFFGAHLMRADHNETVHIVEMRGLTADTIPGAFRELKAIASGTRCTNFFYHANINTRADEQLTPEQWQLAADTLERELGLVDQPRFIVQHLKEGRTHQHVVWGRIDPFTMRAVSDSLTYQKHESAARELEQTFGHEPVPSVLVKDREGERPARNPKDWESLRAQDSKLDPKAITAEVTSLWNTSDSGAAFAAALAERGYILTRGDKRDFCIVDTYGDEHSLGRRISGVKAAAVRERMVDVDRETLPSVAEGRALARAQFDAAGDAEAPGSESTADVPEEAPQGESGQVQPVDDIDARHAKLTAALQPQEPAGTATVPPSATAAYTMLDAVHSRTVERAAASKQLRDAEEAARPGSRLERVRAWWGNMRTHFDDWRGHLQERVEYYRSQWQNETPSPATPEPVPPPSPAAEPEL